MDQSTFERFRDDVKQALRLEDILAAMGVELRVVGHELRARSPFNDDRHPSFYVNPAKQLWHDYSGGGAGGGDVFALLMKRDRLTFGEALREAARLAGIEFPTLDTEEGRAQVKRAADLRSLRDLLTRAAAYYHQCLSAEVRARYFHTQYGFSDDTIDSLRLGWSDGTLRRHFIGELGLDRTQCLATGLFVEAGGELCDFFQNRLVFPYWKDGQVAYFTARRTHLTSDAPFEEAKYKKLLTYGDRHRYVSPLLANNTLFNEDAARGAEILVITEGTPDCISAHQAGLACISPATTQFRQDDVARLVELTRRAKKVVLCNDNETGGAGEKGARATATALWEAGRPVFIATLPRPPERDKIDVNDLVREQGAEALHKVIGAAMWWPDYLVAQVPRDLRGPELQVAIAPVIAAASKASELDRNQIVESLAERTGQGKRALNAIIKQAREPARRATAVPASARGDKPVLIVSGKQRSVLIAEMSTVLAAANASTCESARAGRTVPGPVVRRRKGLSILEWTDDGSVRMEPLTEPALYGAFARYADWISEREQGGDVQVSPAAPPSDIVRDLITYPLYDLPRVDSVATTPVIGRSGTLLEAPGLHRDDRLWIASNMSIPPVPTTPSPEEANAARSLLLDDLLVDFPFASPSDRAHAVAALLLPFVRPLIEGCTPLHLFDAPSQGSGKSLLANAIGLVATGVTAASSTLPTDEDEVRKRITSELLEGKPFIILDNADEKGAVDSATLAAAITAHVWTDRLLGSSKTIEVSNRGVWCLTGNNVRLSRDLLRRVVRVRIDPHVPTPWLRSGFKHDPLLRWVAANRAQIVHALLTLAQAWIAAGRPSGGRSLGSFEEWASVVGGILRIAQIEGFLDNLDELYQQGDEEADEWTEFVGAWWKRFEAQPVHVKQLGNLCNELELLPSRGDKGARSQLIRLGFLLRSKLDREFDGRAIRMVGVRDHQRLFRLELTKAEPANASRSDA